MIDLGGSTGGGSPWTRAGLGGGTAEEVTGTPGGDQAWGVGCTAAGFWVLTAGDPVRHSAGGGGGGGGGWIGLAFAELAADGEE